MEPKFKHDCDKCTFLGRHEPSDSDLYYHPTQGRSVLETIVARYGDEGSHYMSGWSFGDSVPELAEAERLAIAAGYAMPTPH